MTNDDSGVNTVLLTLVLVVLVGFGIWWMMSVKVPNTPKETSPLKVEVALPTPTNDTPPPQ